MFDSLLGLEMELSSYADIGWDKKARSPLHGWKTWSEWDIRHKNVINTSTRNVYLVLVHLFTVTVTPIQQYNSVLGPVLFLLYTTPLTSYMPHPKALFVICYEIFAGDTQTQSLWITWKLLRLGRFTLRLCQRYWAVDGKKQRKKTNSNWIMIRLKPFASNHHLLSTWPGTVLLLRQSPCHVCLICCCPCHMCAWGVVKTKSMPHLCLMCC